MATAAASPPRLPLRPAAAADEDGRGEGKSLKVSCSGSSPRAAAAVGGRLSALYYIDQQKGVAVCLATARQSQEEN